MDSVLLMWLYSKFARIRYAGELFYTFFAGYGVIRFLDEMTRYVEPDTIMGPLNLYQWIAVSFFAFGCAGLLGLFGRPPVDTTFMDSRRV
jgi:prolipoprotein diacylglyceryltransferase